MKAHTDFSAAPRDRNILIKTTIYHYWNSDWNPRMNRRDGWYPDGTQWVEAHFDHDEQKWVEWRGNRRTRTTNQLYPIAWAELPEEA